MEMPVIRSCDATTCAYNDDQQCHALAITVGDGDRARCDTYWERSPDGGDPAQAGRVGACRAVDCQHNERLECTATGVTVGENGGTVDCLTFDPR